MEFENVWRIGVFKFRNIGDVLLMTPVLRALREAFPRAEITAIVNSNTAAMLAENPHIDFLLPYGAELRRKTPLHRAAYELAFAWDLRRRGFDLVIDLGMSDRAVWCSLAASPRYFLSFLHHTWGPRNWRRLIITHGRTYPEGPGHEVEKQLWLLEQMGIASRDKTLCLPVAGKDAAWAREFTTPLRREAGRLVHIHPVSRWMFKCWHDGRMAEVIDWLQVEHDARVVLTCSPEPVEMERTAAIVALCRTKPAVLAGNVTLGQLAALSAEADAFMGVDTAPMHMAAAVGTPTVGLFGPSHSGNWAPWAPKTIAIQKIYPEHYRGEEEPEIDGVRDSMHAISTSDVVEAMRQALPLGGIQNSESRIQEGPPPKR